VMGILGDMMFGCPLLDISLYLGYLPTLLYVRTMYQYLTFPELSISQSLLISSVGKRHHCNDLMSKLSMVGFL